MTGTVARVLPGRLLVRRPSPELAAGELTHLTRSPVDPDLALRQWEGYVAVFAARGWTIIEVEPADEHPDGVFVEDTAVVFDELVVLTRPGAASRRGEVASTARAVPAGVPVARITAPGTLEGGDVLKIGRSAYVGRGTRTDAEGLRQLAALVEPRGWTVVPVPVTTVLHLKSAVTALPDGTVLAFPATLDTPHPYPRLLEVPEEPGVAVVDLGDGAVVMSAAAPRTADLLRGRGLDVLPVPISEFEKLEGCVTCLSIRLRPPTARKGGG